MIPDPSLIGAERIVILHTESLENPGGPVVHLDGDRYLNLSLRLHEDINNALIELEDLCTIQKLLLGHFKRVYLRHGLFPANRTELGSSTAL